MDRPRIRFGWRLAWRPAVALLLLWSVPVPAAGDCRPVPTGSAAREPGDFRQGLLWKIESPGVAPSHLFGTFHSSDPRILRLPCPVREAFDRAASYTMEMIMNGTGIVSMAEAMYFNDGRTLKQVLGDGLYRETLAALSAPSAGLPGIDTMKPWAVLMMLTSPRRSAGLFLDLDLQLKATRQSKPTYGLETMQEQIEVFNGLQLEDQVVLLRDAIQTRDRMSGATEALTRLYLKRDLAGLVALAEQHRSEDARVHRDLMDRLLTRRNRNMAQRMTPRLNEGNAFIAVGALHLPGPAGLLELLTAAGYRVTAVY